LPEEKRQGPHYEELKKIMCDTWGNPVSFKDALQRERKVPDFEVKRLLQKLRERHEQGGFATDTPTVMNAAADLGHYDPNATGWVGAHLSRAFLNRAHDFDSLKTPQPAKRAAGLQKSVVFTPVFEHMIERLTDLHGGELPDGEKNAVLDFQRIVVAAATRQFKEGEGRVEEQVAAVEGEKQRLINFWCKNYLDKWAPRNLPFSKFVEALKKKTGA